MFLFLKNAFGFVHECIVLRQLMKTWVGVVGIGSVGVTLR